MVGVPWCLHLEVLTRFCSGDPLLGLLYSRNDNDEEESETRSAPEQS
jgi:hypothetical protein